MSGVLNTVVTSTAVTAVDLGSGERGMWPLTAARHVLRWAVLLARVGGLPLEGGSTGELVHGSVVTRVPAVGSWVSVAVAGALFGVQLTRRVRRREQRRIGYAVAVYVAEVAGAIAVAVIAVRAADGLTESALARGPGAMEVAAMVNPGSTGVPDPGGLGSAADTAALLLVCASGWFYLVEMTGRLAVLLAVIAAIPLLAGGVRASARPLWRRRALRWAIIAILSKPVLTVVLMAGVAELVRSDTGSLPGWVALVAGAAGLVLLVSGPITAFQFTHVPASASADRSRWSSPGLLTRLIWGPVRRAEVLDQGEKPDPKRRTAAEEPAPPTRHPHRARCPRARRPGERRPSTWVPLPGERIVVALLAAVRGWRPGLRRGSAGKTGAAGVGTTDDGVAWPVVRELATPSVPAVTPTPTATPAVTPTPTVTPASAGPRRGHVNPVAEPRDEPMLHQEATPPGTAGANRSAVSTARPDSSGATRTAERARPGGPSTGPGINGDGPSGRVATEAPTGGVSAAPPTRPEEGDSVGRVGVGGGGVGEAADAEIAGDAVSEPAARPPWALVILGRPVLLAVGPDGDGTARARIGTARTGSDSDSAVRFGGGGAESVHVVAVEVTARLTPKMLELLVYLAVHPHGVRRDAVVAALWPDTARARPANNLSALITRLRSALSGDIRGAATGHSVSPGSTAAIELGGLVANDGDRYLIDPDHVWVDYWSFLASTDQGMAGSAGAVGREPRLSDAAVAALYAAHELYGGQLADGLDGEWVLSVREAARRSFLDVTARLVRFHVRDSPAEALRLLEKARNLDPANEKLYRDIIALQLRTGDDDGAQRTLRLLETQLADIDETVSDALAALAQNIDRPRA